MRLKVETKGEKLWSDLTSDAYLNMRYVDQNWGSESTMLRMLVQAKDRGQNALTVGAFRDAFAVVDEVFSLQSSGYSYRDLCAKNAVGACLVSGALRFFGANQTAFESQVSSDADVLAAVSSATYPDTGELVLRESIFGGLSATGPSIASAPVWRLDFVLDGSVPSSEKLAWEKVVIDNFVRSDYAEARQTYDHIHLEIWSTGRSLDDELQRTVGGDIKFMAVSYIFLVGACALMLGHPLRSVSGRRMLGVCDFFLVVFAMIAGYGVSSALGVPFTQLQQILPFILVGIGVDDAYVLADAFDRTDSRKPIEWRMRDAMMLEGMSVTLTSHTDMVAFLCGAMSSFPAVSYFCTYAAVSLVFVYAFHVTAFCAMLALDARRQEEGRLDVICCVSPKAGAPTAADWLAVPLGERMMVRFCKAITCHVAVKLAIVCTFLSFTGICLWQAVEKTNTDFNIMDLTLDSSYMRDFLEAELEYWGGDSTGMHLEVALYFRGLEASDAGTQLEMAASEDKLLALSCIDEKAGVHSWHRGFTAWARERKSAAPEGLWAATDFEAAGGEEFLTGPSFYPALRHWLADCRLGCRFKDDVAFVGEGAVNASRVKAYQVSMNTSRDQVDCLTEVERFNEERGVVLPGSFAFNWMHVFYHHQRIIRQELFWTTGMCFTAVLVVSLAILPQPMAVLPIFGVVVLVFVDLLGCIPMSGLSLNSISMINLVMAIGLVVDYSMHIAHSFMCQDPKLSRDERAVLAMKHMGLSVAKGVLSTLVAILPLAFASSEVFRVFFKMFLAILIVGGSHGLVLMPVVLSLVGPAAYRPKGAAESPSCEVRM